MAEGGSRQVVTDQAWLRFRAFSAMTLRQCRHPAVRSSNSSASRTVRGIGGGSRGWLWTGHGRNQDHDSMSHDTVTVRCDRIGIR